MVKVYYGGFPEIPKEVLNSEHLEDIDGYELVLDHIKGLEYHLYPEHVTSGFHHTRLNKAPTYDERPIIQKVSSKVNEVPHSKYGYGQLEITVEVSPYYGFIKNREEQVSTYFTAPYDSIKLNLKEYVEPEPRKGLLKLLFG